MKIKNVKKSCRKIGKKVYKKFFGMEHKYTIAKLCKEFGVDVPDNLKDVQNDIITNITAKEADVVPGSVFFVGYYILRSNNAFEELVKNGAKAIFVDPEFIYFDIDYKYPVVVIEKDFWKKQAELFYKIKKQYKAKTIAITGSIGKTTTKDLLNCVVKEEFNTLCSVGNNNTYTSVMKYIYTKLKKNHEVYIQECSAFRPLAVERSAVMLRPDAYILTNILPHHLNSYEVIENVFYDKTSFSRYMSKNGVVFANYDDKLIANYDFPHKVVSFGIDTEKKVNYRAINIKQNGEYLEMDIVYGDDEKCHIRVNVVGRHNAYNILAVFATSKWLGISDEKIKNHLLNFKTKGIRQNVINVNGITFFLDCYNVCNASIKAGIKAIEEMNIANGNKKYAFIGGENSLGENYFDIEYNFGLELVDNKLDKLICYSLADDTINQINLYGDSRPIYKALKDHNCKNAKLITDHETLLSFMKNNIKPGDIVLIKGNSELDMHAAIDQLFGTALLLDYDYTPGRDAVVSDGVYDMNIKTDFKYGSLDKCYKYTKVAKIPNEIEGNKVHRIGSKLFRNTNIEKIDFGNKVANIGFAAFARCNNLKKLIIPKNIKWISESAFANCKNLDEVIIEGATNICENAFYGCSNLKNVELPDTVLHIHENAFKNSNNIVFECNKDSYAEKYAKEHNIKVITKRK